MKEKVKVPISGLRLSTYTEKEKRKKKKNYKGDKETLKKGNINNKITKKSNNWDFQLV